MPFRVVIENFEAFARSLSFVKSTKKQGWLSKILIVGTLKIGLDTGGRYIVICYKATEFSGTLQSSEEGEEFLVCKDQIPNLNLAYDMLPLMWKWWAPATSQSFSLRPVQKTIGKRKSSSFTK